MISGCMIRGRVKINVFSHKYYKSGKVIKNAECCLACKEFPCCCFINNIGDLLFFPNIDVVTVSDSEKTGIVIFDYAGFL